MESHTYQYRNEFLNRTTFNTISRLRQSYNDGILPQDTYQDTMSELCKLRDTFDEKDNEEIETSLKYITEKVGTWSFFELLELHIGEDFMSHFDADHDMLCFYNQVFFPTVCMPWPTMTDLLTGPTASGKFSGIIEPAAIQFLGDKTEFGLTKGCLIIFTEDNSFAVMGDYINDTCEYYCSKYKFLKERQQEALRRIKLGDFTKEYLQNMSIKEFSTMRIEELIVHISAAHQDYKKYPSFDEKKITRLFEKGNTSEKREQLTLLLMQDSHPTVIPKLVQKLDAQTYSQIFASLHLQLQRKIQNYKVVEELNTLVGKRKRSDSLTLEDKVNESKAPPVGIDKAMQKIRSIRASRDGDAKAEKYVEGFLKMPFGVYREERMLATTRKLITRGESLRKKLRIKIPPITRENAFRELLNNAKASGKSKRLITKFEKDTHTHKKEKMRYLSTARNVLNRAVYGHDDAKDQIERIMAQWLNGEQRGTVIGLQGPPGNGKTSLIQEGLAKCLKDTDGNQHPFVFIPLGGLTNGSSLLGHSYTYVGSIWGRIADGLIEAKCMNPIFYFDELDKVSMTERGQEIISVLTHLTDSTQNQKFYDEFFQGIPLDLSKALFVFTFNDPSRVDRVLRDRIQIIKTNALQIPEKLVIAQNYLLPKIIDEIGFDKSDITFEDEQIRTVIENYTAEAGVRKLKELLYDITREVNRQAITEKIELPIRVTSELIGDILKRKPRINHEVIHSNASVGIMNGLYASSSGLGGITKIEASKTHANKTVMDLKLTGNQGDIMKESMSCAKTVSWNFLTEKEQKEINENSFALHVHCPSGATPKDGPSAGGAITLAILSLLKGVPLPNDIAMTGEIDLRGNITEIGGLSEKLLGAKKAGVRQVYVPRENKRDLDTILADGLIIPDETFKINTVEHISELTKLFF